MAAPGFVEQQNLPIPACAIPGYESHRATTIIIAPKGGVNEVLRRPSNKTSAEF
jgi:hypothetical protein